MGWITVNDITKVESFGEGHLYWENLDVDLSLEMIEHPERFLLQAHTQQIIEAINYPNG